jgi:hypothetical protein
MTADDRAPEPEPAISGEAAEAAHVFHDRMLAAGEGWLVFCATHGVDPWAASVEHIHQAALDLRANGGSEMNVLDLIDQVGFMTGLWRTAEWIHLRRTI